MIADLAKTASFSEKSLLKIPRVESGRGGCLKSSSGLHTLTGEYTYTYKMCVCTPVHTHKSRGNLLV